MSRFNAKGTKYDLGHNTYFRIINSITSPLSTFEQRLILQKLIFSIEDLDNAIAEVRTLAEAVRKSGTTVPPSAALPTVPAEVRPAKDKRVASSGDGAVAGVPNAT